MKKKIEKIDALGISTHYETLPFGRKNEFVRRVADILQLSTDTVRRRIARREFKYIEIHALKSAGVI